MSEQEFVTPQHKHNWAEWKCPYCGEDAVYTGMAQGPYLDVEGFESQTWFYEWPRYFCDQCNLQFDGLSHAVRYPESYSEGQ